MSRTLLKTLNIKAGRVLILHPAQNKRSGCVRLHNRLVPTPHVVRLVAMCSISVVRYEVRYQNTDA